MNAKQRRRAYRALPKAGQIVLLAGAVLGHVRTMKVIGPAVPPAVHFGDAEFTRYSLFRVKLRAVEGESTCSPNVKKLRLA